MDRSHFAIRNHPQRRHPEVGRHFPPRFGRGAIGHAAGIVFFAVRDEVSVVDLLVLVNFAPRQNFVKDDTGSCLVAFNLPQIGEIRDNALRFLAMAEAHPHAFALIATRRWRTPGALALANRMVTLLAATGLSPRDALCRARVIGAYLNGAGLGLSSWQLIPGSREDEPGRLASPGAALDAKSVKNDLIDGLDRLLRTID